MSNGGATGSRVGLGLWLQCSRGSQMRLCHDISAFVVQESSYLSQDLEISINAIRWYSRYLVFLMKIMKIQINDANCTARLLG